MQAFNIPKLYTQLVRVFRNVILRYKQLKLWQRFMCLFMVSVLLMSVVLLAIPQRSVFAATGEIVPNGDSTVQWTVAGSNDVSCAGGTHCDKVGEGSTPLTAGYVETGLSGGGGEVEDFNMSTLTSVSSATSITLYMYVRDADGVAQGGTFDDVDMTINIGGADQTPSTKTISSGSYGWQSASWSGSWSQANIDGVRAKFTRTVQGGGSPASRDDNVQIASVYMSVTYTQSITYEQSAYRFYANADSTNVGSTLAALNTAMTNAQTPVQGTPFRLRMLMHVGSGTLSLSGQSFKLQYAQTATCSSGSYSDMTLTTPIAYYNNATPADGASLTTNGNDPTHSGHTVRAQTYEEQNNFTNSVSSVSPNEDALWDFSLVVTAGASENTSYCVRMVTSAGATLSTYSQYPRLTTQVRSLEQSSYRWYENSNVQEIPQVTSYYFNGSIGISDPDEAWVLDSNAFNGNTGNGASVSFNGSISTNYLLGQGTNAPATGDGIEQVRFRVNGYYIHFSGNPIVSVNVYNAAQLELLGTVNMVDNAWSAWVVLNAPAGGWTWETVQELEALSYMTGFVDDTVVLSAIEIEVRSSIALNSLTSQDTNLDTTTDEIQHARLRAGVHADGHGIAAGEAFKLQYAERGSDLMCDPSGTGESYQDVSSPLGTDWTKATGASNLFSSRYQNSMASFKGDLYVFGGVSAGTTYRTDALYKSTDDGVTWSQVTMTGTAPTARRSQSMLVYDDKLWVIGGESSGYLDDVYSSSDGTNWTQVRANGAGSGFGGRMEHGAVVYNNKLWVMGGYNGAWLSTVYSSTDGATWTAETSMPAGLANFGYSVKDNKIWITGGTSSGIVVEDDVLSFDGTSWTTESSNPLFDSVYGHVQLTLDDKLWVIAGDPSTETTSDELNFVYASSDGITWSEVTLDAGFSARQLIGGTVHNDYYMYIAGGYDGAANDEVWYSGSGGISGPEISSSTAFMSGSSFIEDTSIGTLPWSGYSNVATSDDTRATVYVGPSQITHYNKATGFNMSIPAGATVSGIEVGVEGSNSFSAVVKGHLVKNGIIQTGYFDSVGLPGSEGYRLMGGAADLWGNTWTADDINNGSFGIAIYGDGSIYGGDLAVDHIQISVYYTYEDNSSVAFYDNTNIISGSGLASSVDDPTHSGHTNVMQSYVEQNNFTALSNVEPGQDALWDFSLAYYGPPALRQAYCFRIVEADGSLLDTYTVMPQLTIAPAPLQLMRTGRYWSDGQEQPFAL